MTFIDMIKFKLSHISRLELTYTIKINKKSVHKLNFETLFEF